MLSVLRTNLAWMLVALAMSSTLWATVANQQNPEVTSFVAGVPIELRDRPQALVATSPILPVNVDIKAPLDLLPRLGPASFKAYVDLSGASPGTQEFRVQVEATDRRVQVEKMSPDRIILRLEAIRKKDVPVYLTVSDNPPFGYTAKQAKVTPDQVTVSGPEGQVDKVATAAVEVRLENARTSIRQPIRLTPQDAGGMPVSDVTTAPESVLVELPIEQQLTYKALPVAPQIAGSVAFGYQIVGIMIDPTVLTVVGDPNVLQDQAFLSTKPIDVASITADKVTAAEVVLPSGISLVRQQSLTVRVYVSPVEANKVVRVTPQLTGLADRLRAELDPAAVDVTVSGPMPLLSTLKPQEVHVTLDVSGISTGTKAITVTASVPSPLKIDEISPRRISVAIKPP